MLNKLLSKRVNKPQPLELAHTLLVILNQLVIQPKVLLNKRVTKMQQMDTMLQPIRMQQFQLTQLTPTRLVSMPTNLVKPELMTSKMAQLLQTLSILLHTTRLKRHTMMLLRQSVPTQIHQQLLVIVHRYTKLLMQRQSTT